MTIAETLKAIGLEPPEPGKRIPLMKLDAALSRPVSSKRDAIIVALRRARLV
jgi:hypothetical protein